MPLAIGPLANSIYVVSFFSMAYRKLDGGKVPRQ
jgi:hypothetical protein